MQPVSFGQYNNLSYNQNYPQQQSQQSYRYDGYNQSQSQQPSNSGQGYSGSNNQSQYLQFGAEYCEHCPSWQMTPEAQVAYNSGAQSHTGYLADLKI